MIDTDTETGYRDEPEAPEAQASYWLRDTRDESIALHRPDGSIFADVRKALDGDFSAWIFYANDTIVPAQFKSELSAIRACDAMLKMERAR